MAIGAGDNVQGGHVPAFSSYVVGEMSFSLVLQRKIGPTTLSRLMVPIRLITHGFDERPRR